VKSQCREQSQQQQQQQGGGEIGAGPVKTACVVHMNVRPEKNEEENAPQVLVVDTKRIARAIAPSSFFRFYLSFSFSCFVASRSLFTSAFSPPLLSYHSTTLLSFLLPFFLTFI